MAEWTLLDDSYKNLVTVRDTLHQEVRKREPIQSPLTFGYPRNQTAFLSMVAAKHWLKSTGVKIYYKGLEKLRPITGRRNLLMPNHPNPFDSVALRYLLYVGKKTIPMTAAVDGFAKIPMMTRIMKENGSFFITPQRFQDPVYRGQVNSLVCNLADQGEWVQLYFEGSRRLHERQRVARSGGLKALLDKPCAWFPISLSYEKIAGSYTKHIGSVYIEIHDPILTEPDEQFEPFVAQLTETVQRGVNVFTTDLVATILLNRKPGTSLSLVDLEDDVCWLRAVLVSREVSVVDQPLGTALSYLDVKVVKKQVTVPVYDQNQLIHYRERILHTLYDISNPPDFIAKEFAWTPPPSLIHSEQLHDLSSRAVAPLVNLYTSIITLLDRGVQQVSEIEEEVVTATTNIDTVRNTLRILQEQGVIGVQNGLITLL